MSVDQVVSGQVHRGVVHWVDEIGLHHGIISMVHGVGCVDHTDLGVGACTKKKAREKTSRVTDRPQNQSVTEAFPLFFYF